MSPFSSAELYFVPSSSSPPNEGALLRTATGIPSPAGVPATKRNSPPLFTSTASQPGEQPATSRTAPAGASTTRLMRPAPPSSGPGRPAWWGRARRLGVVDAGDPIADVGHRGHAGQRALPATGVVHV